MTARTSMLHVRLDDDVKANASRALEAMGLSMADAVRIFLRRIVADQAFRLELKVPNAATRAAMAEADEIVDKRGGRFGTANELLDDLQKTG